MIHRRLIIEFEPPVDWPDVFSQIRRLSGFGSGAIQFTLQCDHGQLARWEAGRNKPNYENGRNILKMLEYFKSARHSADKCP